MSKGKAGEYNPEKDDCEILYYNPLPLTREEQEVYEARKKARKEAREAARAAEGANAGGKKRIILQPEPEEPFHVIYLRIGELTKNEQERQEADKKQESQEPAKEQGSHEPAEEQGNFAMEMVWNEAQNGVVDRASDTSGSPDNERPSITGQASDVDQASGEAGSSDEDVPLLGEKDILEASRILEKLRSSPVPRLQADRRADQEADPSRLSPDFTGVDVWGPDSGSTHGSLPDSPDEVPDFVPPEEASSFGLPEGASSFVPDSQPSQEAAAMPMYPVPEALLLGSYAVPSGEDQTYVPETQGSQAADQAAGDVRVASEHVPVPVPAPDAGGPAAEAGPGAEEPAAKAAPPEQDMESLVSEWLREWADEEQDLAPFELFPNKSKMPEWLPEGTIFIPGRVFYNWYEMYEGLTFKTETVSCKSELIPEMDMTCLNVPRFQPILKEAFPGYNPKDTAHPAALFKVTTCMKIGRKKQPVNLWKQDKSSKKLELLISDPEAKRTGTEKDILAVFVEEENRYFYISLKRELAKA